MNIATHPVSPEEVMAYVDGELSAAEAQELLKHIGECADCAALAEEFRAMSQTMAAWTVEDSQVNLERVLSRSKAAPSWGVEHRQAGTADRTSLWTPRRWAFGGLGAALLLVAMLAVTLPFRNQLHSTRTFVNRLGEPLTQNLPLRDPRSMPSPMPSPALPLQMDRLQSAARRPNTQSAIRLPDSPAQMDAAPPPAASMGVIGGNVHPPPVAPNAAQSNPSMPAPMIARSVALTIVVRDFGAARSNVDAILQRHQGYSAQLDLNTPGNAARSFRASLRIPAPELNAAIGELRTLGHVESESQSGEEVTQQLADLVARLKTARDTEDRFRAILEQRTGRIEDVLQVEQEIARVRGEIESMEAEQKALEHRVDFASVELQLAEEYQVQLDSHEDSVSTRMHNAFVRGFRNAAGLLVGIVLFVMEFGPVLFVLSLILGVPVFLVWRRHRAMRSKAGE